MQMNKCSGCGDKVAIAGKYKGYTYRETTPEESKGKWDWVITDPDGVKTFWSGGLTSLEWHVYHLHRHRLLNKADAEGSDSTDEDVWQDVEGGDFGGLNRAFKCKGCGVGIDFDEMFQNYLFGNMSIFKNKLRALDKRDIVGFIKWVYTEQGADMDRVKLDLLFERMIRMLE